MAHQLLAATAALGRVILFPTAGLRRLRKPRMAPPALPAAAHLQQRHIRLSSQVNRPTSRSLFTHHLPVLDLGPLELEPEQLRFPPPRPQARHLNPVLLSLLAPASP